MIDVERNIWVWAVGGKFWWPQAILGDADMIHETIENNPRSIFFYGPKEMAEMNWFTPCSYDNLVTYMMDNLEV